MKLSKQNLSLSLSEFPRVVEGFPRTKISNKQGPESSVKSSERGRSMVEMLGLLAITGILTIGGIAGYSKAMHKYKINKTINQFGEIITNIRAAYSGQKNYDGLGDYWSDGYCYGNKLFIPKEGLAAVTQSSNPDATSYISISSTRLNEEDSSYIGAVEIKAGAFSLEDCATLASTDWKSIVGENLIGIGFGELSSHIDVLEKDTTTRTEGFFGFGKKYIPLSPTDAAAYCQEVYSYHGNSMRFSIKFY